MRPTAPTVAGIRRDAQGGHASKSATVRRPDMKESTGGSAGQADPDVGQGTSIKLDLGEAIKAAVARMPRGPGDTGHSVVVEEISYTDGGIVGPALHVRVRSRGM